MNHKTHGGGIAGPADALLEAELRRTLDELADLGAEQAPDLGALASLVAEVQREQRRATLRDLALFWSGAAVVLTAGLYAAAQHPTLFLLLQAFAGTTMLVGALLWLPVQRWAER